MSQSPHIGATDKYGYGLEWLEPAGVVSKHLMGSTVSVVSPFVKDPPICCCDR